MSTDNHKIDADDRNVFDVLNERKYTVDYFQREYKWEQKHIEQLVTDLTSTFLDVYAEGDSRTAVEHYNNYYLGPFVVSSKDGMKSIIDGQQRLTSLTLLLIFLNNLQKALGGNESIEPLVFSEKYGQKSFNIQVEERKTCLERLFLEGSYEVQPDDDESTVTMAERYANIGEAFPEEIKGAAFPYFLDIGGIVEMLVGYARVSAIHQNLDRQLPLLRAAGCKRVFKEKEFGREGVRRPELERAIEALGPGDVLVLAEWDRATRSMMDGIRIIERVGARGAMLKALDRQWLDLTTSHRQGHSRFSFRSR